MERWLALAAAVVTVLALISLIPLKLEFHYRRHGREDFVALGLHAPAAIWGYRLEVPVLDLLWEGEWPSLLADAKLRGPRGGVLHRGKGKLGRILLPPLPRGRAFWRLAKELLALNRRFYRTVHLKRFHWKTILGLEDPAATALAYGAAWSFLASVYRNLYLNVRSEGSSTRLALLPSFTGARLDTELDCIFSVRVGHIMITVLAAAWKVLPYLWRGGFRRERASH